MEMRYFIAVLIKFGFGRNCLYSSLWGAFLCYDGLVVVFNYTRDIWTNTPRKNLYNNSSFSFIHLIIGLIILYFWHVRRFVRFPKQSQTMPWRPIKNVVTSSAVQMRLILVPYTY